MSDTLAQPVLPIRLLYTQLCQMEDRGADTLHYNLQTAHDDYNAMRGSPEPRFYEWAHTRLEGRTFISGITEGVLRTSDLLKLAHQCGVPPKDLQELGKDKALLARRAMGAIGVREPEHPRGIQDGVRAMERAATSLNAVTSGRETTSNGSESLARRGAERFLASLVLFLWDAGHRQILCDVVRERHHGFQASAWLAKSLEHGDEKFIDWLLKPRGADLGSMNHLLRCVSKEMAEKTPAFLGDGRAVWHEDAFRAFDKLARALHPIAHDLNRAEVTADDLQILGNIEKAATSVLELMRDNGIIWRPRAVIFFRRIHDGHGVHYEGWDDTNTRRMFFECQKEFQLHERYVYVAATNPQAVDAACVPQREMHTNPIAFDVE